MLQKQLPELSKLGSVPRWVPLGEDNPHLYTFRVLPRPRVASFPRAFVYVTLRSRQAPPPSLRAAAFPAPRRFSP